MVRRKKPIASEPLTKGFGSDLLELKYKRTFTCINTKEKDARALFLMTESRDELQRQLEEMTTLKVALDVSLNITKEQRNTLEQTFVENIKSYINGNILFPLFIQKITPLFSRTIEFKGGVLTEWPGTYISGDITADAVWQDTTRDESNVVGIMHLNDVSYRAVFFEFNQNTGIISNLQTRYLTGMTAINRATEQQKETQFDALLQRGNNDGYPTIKQDGTDTFNAAPWGLKGITYEYKPK